MNKRDFAGVLVRAVGVWMMASGLVHFIRSLWETLSQVFRFGFHAYAFALPLIAFLSIGIGLHLLFRGSWIADKLVEVDDADDP